MKKYSEIIQQQNGLQIENPLVEWMIVWPEGILDLLSPCQKHRVAVNVIMCGDEMSTKGAISKHMTPAQCCLDAGPSSTTLAQHLINIWPA